MPPGKHNQPHNPYSSAAGAYGTNAQKHAEDPRELEARVLLKSAKFMQDLQNDWDNLDIGLLGETLKYNRSIWLMFMDTAAENVDDRPATLRSNIVNLARFVFKREVDIIANPEKNKLDVLIKINHDIANGLLTGMKNAPAKTAEARQPGENQDAKKPPSGGWDTSA